MLSHGLSAMREEESHIQPPSNSLKQIVLEVEEQAVSLSGSSMQFLCDQTASWRTWSILRLPVSQCGSPPSVSLSGGEGNGVEFSVGGLQGAVQALYSGLSLWVLRSLGEVYELIQTVYSLSGSSHSRIILDINNNFSPGRFWEGASQGGERGRRQASPLPHQSIPCQEISILDHVGSGVGGRTIILFSYEHRRCLCLVVCGL